MSSDSQPADAGGGGRATAVTIDIADEIDNAPWTGMQKMVMAVAAVAVIIDGFDIQLLGLSIPAIARTFGIAPANLSAQFGWILSLGFVGTGIGAALGGYFGDRIGRKTSLSAALAIIGITTLLAALTPNLLLLGLLRIVTGLGIGMVLPLVASLVAEYTPVRRRSLAVALSIVCVPVGGLLGGIVAAALLVTLGWRGLWVIGGVLPILMIVLIHVLVPESPQFQAARGTQKDRERVVATLRRMGHNISPDSQFVNHHDHERKRASFTALLKPEHRWDSIGIWIAFFGSLMGVYMTYGSGPTLLRTGFQFSSAEASLSITWYNIGAIILAVVGSWAMAKWGSKPVLLVLAGGATLSAAWLWLAPPEVGGGASGLFITQFIIHGGFMAGLQVVLYSLCAQLYPVSIKAIGVGMASGVGRTGAIVASFIGLALVATGSTFFLVIAAASLACGLAMLIVRHHTPPTSQGSIY
jgi:AAHS family 4-hydroxybenzoate transporter-like MFS transporter